MLTIDFETFYSKEFSLSKITTEEYIRSPLFEVIGVSVQKDDEPGVWCTGDFATIHLFLSQYDWANEAANSHNAMFDMAILGWRFGIYPKFVVDTMSMAKAIFGTRMSCSLAKLADYFGLEEKGHEVQSALGLRLADMPAAFLAEYGAYCVKDSRICRELFKRMRPSLPMEELCAIDWTIQCYSRPTLRIDGVQAQLALTQHMSIKANTLMQLGVTQEALRSDDIMAEMLINLGVEPPTKFSGKQVDANGDPKEMWAFAKSDTDFMDLVEHEDSRVVALVEARLANKTSIVESRLGAFCDIATRGAMPYPVAYASAQPTLRWQAWKQQKINLQNLPRRKKGERSPLRDAICAPPGYKLGVVDLSQIELRVNAWLAGQENVLEMLRTGSDVYSATATRIFGYLVTKDLKMERFVGKTATLGCGYQCGGPKFTTMLKVAARRDGFKLTDESLPFGMKCVSEYRADNPMIVQFWADCARALDVMMQGGSTKLGPLDIVNGRIAMPDGMWMEYPGLQYYTDPKTGKQGIIYEKFMGRGVAKKWIYGGLLDENLSQRIARGIFRDGMLRVKQRYWCVGSVHDELLFIFPENEPEEIAVDYAVECMTQPVVWAPNLPLAAEGDAGYRYGDAKA